MQAWMLCFALALAATSVSALESNTKQDYSKLPGFMNIEGLGIFTEEDATVEVFLDEKLLGMVAQMASSEPDLSEAILGLKLVRVQRYRMDEDQIEQVNKKTGEMATKLEKDDWKRVVRIRERDETVYVYFKLGETTVQGVTVMVVEEYEGYATFVNIVGEIDPAQVGRLGRKFHIDALNMDWDDLQDLEELRERQDDRDKGDKAKPDDKPGDKPDGSPEKKDRG
jgi:hypothetical protein